MIFSDSSGMCWTANCPTDQLTAAATWMQAIGTTLTFIVAGVAAFWAWKQVGEARRLRELQAEPFVTLSLKIVNGDGVELVIENIGTTVAHTVRFEFFPEYAPAANFQGFEPSKTKLWKEGVPTLVPGQRIALVIDRLQPRHDSASLPQSYNVIVTCRGERKLNLLKRVYCRMRRREAVRIYSRKYILDFEAYYGHGEIERIGLAEISTALSEIGSTLGSMVELPRSRLKVSAYYGEKKIRAPGETIGGKPKEPARRTRGEIASDRRRKRRGR